MKRSLLYIFTIILFAFSILSNLFIFSCNPNNSELKADDTNLNETNEIILRLCAGGDFIPHIRVLKSAATYKDFYDTLNFNGFRYLINEIKPIFENCDIGIINFETPCSPTFEKNHRPFVFNVTKDAIGALKWMGVNVFMLANNHIFDQGRLGFRETIQMFERHNAIFTGIATSKEQAEKPIIMNIKGIRIAIVSFSEFVNNNLNDSNRAWVNIFDLNTALSIIKKYKDSSDAIIVTFHGGVEYANAPLPQHKQYFRTLIDSGATAVIGTHPHVPQPIEIYTTKDGRKAPIFYSLGNFISNQSRGYHIGSNIKLGDTRDVIIANFDLVFTKKNGRWEYDIKNISAIPCWTENIATKNSIAIRTVWIQKELESLEKKIDSCKKYSSHQGLLSELNSKKNLYLKRISRMKVVVGDSFINTNFKSKEVK